MSAPEPHILVEDLTMAYGSFVLQHDLTFTINKSDIFIIMGGSGCGKSTLLRHLVGLKEPAKGRVLYGQTNFWETAPEECDQIMRGLGILYQSGALFGSMTVLENIRLVLEEFTNLSRDAMDMICRIRLNLVGLSDAADKFPSELSGGMQKRAAVARAMALDPAIIFLDEPSAGLDPITAADFDQMILRLARNLHITFVVVTHELDSIYTIADHVIMLDKVTKKIVASGVPQELRDHSDNPWVRQFFNRKPSEEYTQSCGREDSQK